MRAAWFTLVAGCATHVYRPTPADNPLQVADSSGAGFGWSCTSSGCSVVGTTNTPPLPTCNGGEVANYGFSADRFVSINAACGNVWFSEWQRPVICSADNDCPQLYEFPTAEWFACRNGLCQNADTRTFPVDTIAQLDVFLLCYGPIPRPDTLSLSSPDAVTVTMLVNSACPSGPEGACSLPLPTPCVQP